MSASVKKVFVSGCFDLLHSGHVCFLQAAAQYGELYVAVGSDAAVADLKGRPPLCPQDERLFLVKALGCVAGAGISRGTGLLDFEEDLRRIRPDVFVVNEDGDSPRKLALCRELGIEYVVLRREPAPGLPARSTTGLRSRSEIPYRIDLAGGWLDQPFVSRCWPGAVIVVSILPTHDFALRSGMATSTRRSAQKIWGQRIPPGDPEERARLLFACENPPGKEEISGSQDAIGVVFPGVNRLEYRGGYWPETIRSVVDEATLSWLERLIWLKPLVPRPGEFSVLEETSIDAPRARALAETADACWSAILGRDAAALGRAVYGTLQAQVRMFPRMVTPPIQSILEDWLAISLGVKLSGAGGGGYVVAISEKPLDDCRRVTIARPELDEPGSPGSADVPPTAESDCRK